MTAEKIGCFSVDADVDRIAGRIRRPLSVAPETLEPYRPPAIRARWMAIEPQLLEHFAAVDTGVTTVDYDTTEPRRYRLATVPEPPLWRRAGGRAKSVLRRRLHGSERDRPLV